MEKGDGKFCIVLNVIMSQCHYLLKYELGSNMRGEREINNNRSVKGKMGQVGLKLFQYSVIQFKRFLLKRIISCVSKHCISITYIENSRGLKFIC